MKNILIVVILSVILFSSCKKDDSDPLQVLGSFVIDGDLNFLDIEIGESETNELAILNESENPVEIYSISLPNNAFQVNWDSGIIEPGATQYIEVTFTPTSPESYSGELVIENDTYTENNSVFITANGIENSNPNPITYITGNFQMSFVNGTANCDNGNNGNEGGALHKLKFNNDNTITFIDNNTDLNDYVTVNNYTYNQVTNTITTLNITIEFPNTNTCYYRTITINITDAVATTLLSSDYRGEAHSTVVYHYDACFFTNSDCTFTMFINKQ